MKLFANSFISQWNLASMGLSRILSPGPCHNAADESDSPIYVMVSNTGMTYLETYESCTLFFSLEDKHGKAIGLCVPRHSHGDGKNETR